MTDAVHAAPHLRPARVDDLDNVLTWPADATACRRWAGPRLPFPTTANTAWMTLEASSENSFALVDGEGELLGFGQLLERDYRVVHLARLTVAPAHRGRGLGRVLCRALSDRARDAFAARRLTLNVYADNHTALGLYRSLGFTELLRDDSGEMIFMNRVLTAP
ncbi:GNAT family N-acetyltransferase [Modicisalibacter coralii]|uniref:GNAT family N-acetyltransferase n=1 Tax=Modicisalibacter coralii TaxID=2304602 RepID=UPI00100B5AB6|nr:GNAT family N-acetyltransferase [Halomonas coralii]